MRKVSVSKAPLPAGRGFSFLAAVAVAMGLAAAVPAQAAVGVTLKVNGGVTAATVATCPVSVPAGASGIAVLDAALGTGCIAQYRAETFSFGRYVSCIDYVCDVPWRHADVTTGAESASPVYWSMTVNGACTPYGVDGFVATAGKELAFTFTTWLPFLVDSEYCPL